MTAEEIRADLGDKLGIFLKRMDKDSAEELTSKAAVMQMSYLAEIAAQLAELNAALKPAFTPTLTFDGNAEWQPPKGPTLPDPGTSYRRRK